MASPDLQSKVNQLTSKIQGELTTVVDELERYKLRPIAVSSSRSGLMAANGRATALSNYLTQYICFLFLSEEYALVYCILL